MRAFARGWRGIALIAILYIYFLIFAQFGFLTRLAALGIGGNGLKVVMAAMAAGGILFSLFAPRIRLASDPALRLRMGLGTSAAAALLTLAPLNIAAAVVVAFSIGAGLGLSTVTLVANLDRWIGQDRGILKAGIGTGIAYALCNVPAIFAANPQSQGLLAAALCLGGIALVPSRSSVDEDRRAPGRRFPFVVAVLSFAALVWLDSAAFYIVQHTQSLKAGTWLGSMHLWVNAALHFAAAIFAGVLLQRGRTSATLALAFGALGFACLLLSNPALILSASLFYPVGVSLYSVALVAYPAFLSGAVSREERGRQAGILYAVAGWIGSALGIGMGQNLGHVPAPFVAAAGVVVLFPVLFSTLRMHAREAAVVAAGALAALLGYRLLPAPALSAAQRGRQVYISEGCISCHSQYVRPDSPDVLMWGPVEDLADVRSQQPPLIGNRRQGPDLAEVGIRRSTQWLRMHLIDPAACSYRSPMPSYAFLFHDSRGDDLVAYLAGLHGSGVAQQRAREAAWHPDVSAWNSASLKVGEEIYARHCATCHNPNGAARRQWQGAWTKTPPQDLAALHAFAQAQPAEKLAEIAKFGIPDTDMPGHEYLSGRQIASLALWLKQAPPSTKAELTKRRRIL
jgi:mono/diheme cytochrome c family protein